MIFPAVGLTCKNSLLFTALLNSICEPKKYQKYGVSYALAFWMCVWNLTLMCIIFQLIQLMGKLFGSIQIVNLKKNSCLF